MKNLVYSLTKLGYKASDVDHPVRIKLNEINSMQGFPLHSVGMWLSEAQVDIYMLSENGIKCHFPWQQVWQMILWLKSVIKFLITRR